MWLGGPQDLQENAYTGSLRTSRMPSVTNKLTHKSTTRYQLNKMFSNSQIPLHTHTHTPPTTTTRSEGATYVPNQAIPTPSTTTRSEGATYVPNQEIPAPSTARFQSWRNETDHTASPP